MNENNVIVDAKIKTANTVSRLQRSVGDKRLLTSIMTEVLKSENVVMEMVGLTQNPVFPEIFPEFYMKNAYGESFINCQQNNKYHRYGVWKHSLVSVEMVCGEDKPFSDDQATILKWVMLLHDIGKSFVKEINVDGTESFVGHEAKSSEIAAYILGKFDFAQDQIRQMCLLIEYHDTFLNIDDVSYENMLLLFEKMDQDKDLLNMLFEVKEADAKAKNIHSYEIARKVIDGFLALSRDYFNDRYLQKGGVSKFENDQLLGKTDNLGYDPEAIMAATIADSHDYASSETHELMRDCISQMCMKKDIDLLYQPIFDLKSVKVWGYEGYSRNRAHSTLNITQIIDYAKEIDKFDKLQQSMFVNAIEKFALTDKKEVNRFFISIDMDSFSKYANKP
ncbi:MAG: HD domain-containing protein, partial [Clostridia bacterium]